VGVKRRAIELEDVFSSQKSHADICMLDPSIGRYKGSNDNVVP